MKKTGCDPAFTSIGAAVENNMWYREKTIEVAKFMPQMVLREDAITDVKQNTTTLDKLYVCHGMP